MVPRLVGIKTAESSVVNIKYTFCNVASAADYNGNFLIHPELIIDSNVGRKIQSAAINGNGTSYVIADNSRYKYTADLFNSGGSSNVKEVVTRGIYAGNLSLCVDY